MFKLKPNIAVRHESMALKHGSRIISALSPQPQAMIPSKHSISHSFTRIGTSSAQSSIRGLRSLHRTSNTITVVRSEDRRVVATRRQWSRPHSSKPWNIQQRTFASEVESSGTYSLQLLELSLIIPMKAYCTLASLTLTRFWWQTGSKPFSFAFHNPLMV